MLAVAAGIGIGLLIGDWAEAAAGRDRRRCSAPLASVPIVAGALRGGGTRLGLAVLVATGRAGPRRRSRSSRSSATLEAVAVPLFALRLSRRGPDRHAGLRILAKD